MALNALAPVADINRHISLANSQTNLVNPEVFYSKQLLDTIRLDASEYKYYKIADETPIQEKADKLLLRRWAPLQAHTVPLVEGVPPMSDKGSVEKYEISADQYGRYMEFSDKVDFAVVDPVLAHYSREYSIVAMETLDMLAREALAEAAALNTHYANQAASFEDLTVDDSVPTIVDLRLIVLAFKRNLVKPRNGQNYLVICSPEFTYDMVTDPTVEKYMRINQTTKEMYNGSTLFPMFNLEFDETLVCPASGDFKKTINNTMTDCKRIVRQSGTDQTTGKPTYAYATITANTDLDSTDSSKGKVCVDYSSTSSGGAYVKDSRTGQDASFIPNYKEWKIDELKMPDPADTSQSPTAYTDWTELKAHHIYIVGKDALMRTGLSGEGSVKMYTKPKGSAGVLDPIDQRQSIGFKLNSVGFGCTRPEAVADYVCVPTTANLVL